MTRKILAVLMICLLALVFVVPVGFASPVEIVYTRWAGAEEARDFQALVDIFNKENPEIKVVTQFLPWDAYWQKIQTTLIAGDAADVISMSSGMAAEYLSRGVFYDLSQISGAEERLSKMSEGAREVVVVNGQIMGMPVGIGLRCLVYNKDMFDEAGVPYLDPVKPVTWEEFVDLALKLTKIENGQVTQYAFNAESGELHKVLISQAGGSIVDNVAAPTKVTINSPKAIAGLKFMKSLYDQKILPPYQELGPWGNQDNAVATGRVAIMYTGPWGLGAVIDRGIRFGTAPMFMGEERATVGYINFLSIAKNSKHPKEAWKFIEWMTSKEGQVEFTKTGDLPANREALAAVMEAPSRFDLEIMRPYYEDLAYISAQPMVADRRFYGECDNYWRDYLDGRLTVEEAVAKYEETGQRILDEMNRRRRN